MTYEEYKKLALALLKGRMTAEQRFAFATFLGYDPEGPFRLAHLGRTTTMHDRRLEHAVLGFLRDDMKGAEYLYLLIFLGFNPLDLEGEANHQRIEDLYARVDYSSRLWQFMQEQRARKEDEKLRARGYLPE